MSRLIPKPLSRSRKYCHESRINQNLNHISREKMQKFAILSLMTGSLVRILIYRNFSGAHDGRVRSNLTILREKIGDREQCTTPPIMSFS